MESTTHADLTGLLLILEYAAEQASRMALQSTVQLIDRAAHSIKPQLMSVREQNNSKEIRFELSESHDGSSDIEAVDDRAFRNKMYRN